jgi:hypothetical protein
MREGKAGEKRKRDRRREREGKTGEKRERDRRRDNERSGRKDIKKE